MIKIINAVLILFGCSIVLAFVITVLFGKALILSAILGGIWGSIWYIKWGRKVMVRPK